MNKYYPQGRTATSPIDFSWTAWKNIALRVGAQFSHDRIPLIAASAAFYMLLALVPFLAALVSIYGLLFDPQGVATQMAMLSSLLPAEVQSILAEQLTRLTNEPSHTLGIAFAVSLGMSIWSASAATKAVIEGLNIVYGERETRSFVTLSATAFAITLIGLTVLVALVAVTIAVPVVIKAFGLDPLLIQLLGYAGLVLGVWAGMIALYRWAPSRADAKWRWLAPGTCISVIGLIVFSIAFSWFARTFAGYAAYGSIGAIIAFMTWSWIGMIILLVGAEINAEMEHQTARDTTTGRPKPIGLRGAEMADNVSPVVCHDKAASNFDRDAGAQSSAFPTAFAGFVVGVTVAIALTRR